MEGRRKELGNSKAIELFDLMAKKKSNLCISADVTTSKELIKLIEEVGEHVCMVKTHIDIISDFEVSLVDKLIELSKRFEFVLFEDRKFADIGNTVKHQFEGGMYRIAEWADFVDAHTLPGEGIIQGLKAANKKSGLFLLAQMSSKGNLITQEYTTETLTFAKKHIDFVAGFIGADRYDASFLTLTPGISLTERTDSLGQIYRTPKMAVSRGSDILIVGRAILDSQNRRNTVIQFQEACWNAYSSSFE